MGTEPDAVRWNFRDQVVLVTGAAHGIGRRHAELLAKAGARVVLTDLDGDRVVQVAASHGEHALGLRLDVRDEKATKVVVDQAIEHFGHLDALVNNAGATPPAGSTEGAQFREVVDLNLLGTALMCAAVRPHFTARGIGCIVNTASNTVFRHTDDVSAAYVAAKAGVVGLTRALALQLGADGIRVNAVAPGLVAHDDFSRKLAPDRLASMVEVATIAQCLPRPGTVDDISEAVLFLLSGASGWITGQVLIVDGGWSFT